MPGIPGPLTPASAATSCPGPCAHPAGSRRPRHCCWAANRRCSDKSAAVAGSRRKYRCALHGRRHCVCPVDTSPLGEDRSPLPGRTRCESGLDPSARARPGRRARRPRPSGRSHGYRFGWIYGVSSLRNRASCTATWIAWRKSAGSAVLESLNWGGTSMAYVDIVTALAVLQFIVFGFKVGGARGRYGVKAPAIIGNEIFERHFRVQMNTLEQLIAFLPGIYMFAHYFSPKVAAALGVVYLIGRELYALTYVKDPAN